MCVKANFYCSLFVLASSHSPFLSLFHTPSLFLSLSPHPILPGCVWIYRIYKPNYTDRTKGEFCDPTLYQFAFWLVTSVYLIIGLLISCMCGLSIATVIMQHSREASEQV